MVKIPFKKILFFSILALIAAAQKPPKSKAITYPGEVHLKNLRQLTNGGDNAEAYWSFDNRKLVMQSNNPAWGMKCDQIFWWDIRRHNLFQSRPQMVSTGRGRTTCSFFLPGDTLILFASTHEGGDDCPPEPDRSEGYVWPLYDTYDIYVADLKGNIVKKLTDRKGYDAEATVSPRGDKIVFTSDRSGDLELWVMDIDGSNPVQITHELGYDGGAFFSPDGTRIAFRAHYPETEEELADYRRLLAQNLVRPGVVDLYIMDADGSNKVRLTDNRSANFAPFWHPSGRKLIFSSNLLDPGGRHFELFMINDDGTGLERITVHDDFDGFPMFSHDGRFLVWASNRYQELPGETNVFIAEWVEEIGR